MKAVQAKKIEGNPDHPISMGGTCARGQAGVQALYHPDRIQNPLKLSGPRGSGQYQGISWKDAQQLLTTQLQQLQATPQAIAIMTGRRNRGTMGTVVERFAAGLGTTNVVSYDPFDPAPIRKAMELTTGVARLPVVDFANANYLLSFNANLFETFLSPVRPHLLVWPVPTGTCRVFAASSSTPSRACLKRRRVPTSGCRSSPARKDCWPSQSRTSS